MVRAHSAFAAAIGVLGLTASCEVLIGLEDKELAPEGSGGADGGGGSDSGGGGPKGSDPVPPSRPSGAPVPGGGATRWFAAKTIFLGTFDPETKKADNTAWRRIGHDVDGECTTAEISKSNSSSICAQPSGAPPESLEDGDGCRDNAAGRLVAVGTQVVSINFEPELHSGLSTGELPTYLLRLDDLGDQPDDPWVKGSLYVTVPRDPTTTKPPTWDGTDEFVVDAESLALGPADGGADGGGDAAPDSDAEGGLPPSVLDAPRFVFDKGYLSKNVWVSGDLGKSPLSVPLFVFDRITVVDAASVTVTAGLSPSHDSVEASQLSVVVTTTTIESKFRPIAAELVSCIPAAENLLMNAYILPARDLGAPPSLKSPGKACDAESFAFAFEWKPVKAPKWAAPGKPKPKKCVDAGL